MFYQDSTIVMFLKVNIYFLMMYIFIPWRLGRFEAESKGLLDKFFISLIRSTFLINLIVHLLILLKLYDTISLFVTLCITLVLVLRISSKSWYDIIDNLNILDATESGTLLLVNLIERIKKSLKNTCQTLSVLCWNIITKPIAGLLPVIVLLYAYLIRFKNVGEHYAYVHIDMYTHLTFIKNISLNNLYNDGIYPRGFHAIISALHQLTFLDSYWIVRFIGPLGGLLLVLSVYYFAVRMTGNRASGLIALVIYGLVNHPDFPSVMFRQTAALSQEFGEIFVLPGLYMLWLYIKSGKKSFLILYCQAVAITLFIHTYSSLYLLLWSAILVGVSLIFRYLKISSIFVIIRYGFIYSVVGTFPILLGVILGKEFHASSIEMIQQDWSLHSNANYTQLFKSIIASGNRFLDLSSVLLILLVLSFFYIKDHLWRIQTLTIAGIATTMFLLYSAQELGLPQFTQKTRTGNYYAPILTVLYVFAYATIERIIGRLQLVSSALSRKIISGVICVTICLAIIFTYPNTELYHGTEEYDAAAQNYLVIKRNFTYSDWTIVGPNEQFAQALNVGWHFDLLRFLQKFTLEEALDPNFKLPIPTSHIFIYTEKIPLGYQREVNIADAALDLEPEGPDPFMQYFKNKDQRAILEAKAIHWAEAFMSSHENVDIFYEDSQLRIYHIVHKPVIEGEY